MKKIITLVVALATLAVPAATAQKINDSAYKAKLEKSNLDIENPKKSGKAATWITRGKICADAIMEPTKNKIFSGNRKIPAASPSGRSSRPLFSYCDQSEKRGKHFP